MNWRRSIVLLMLLASLGLVASGCAMFTPPPKADLSASPRRGKAPLTVSFDGRGSERAVSYEWGFGDGHSATGSTATHRYSDPGTYTARLTVTDRFNRTDTASTTITVVANKPPQASFTASTTSGNKPLYVSFDGSSSSDPDGRITSYDWSFGDGASGSGESTSHTYTRAGTFTARLTVTDDSGDTDSATQSITVEQPNRRPRCDLDANPTRGPAPLTVNFSGRASDPDGNIVRTTLDFGDGASTSALAASHRYNNPGRYIARLTVVDSERLRCDDSVAIQVGGGGARPRARIARTRLRPYLWIFDGTNSFDPDGGPITRYLWIINPGNFRRAGARIRIRFPQGRPFCVNLIVWDDEGQRGATQMCRQNWRSEKPIVEAEKLTPEEVEKLLAKEETAEKPEDLTIETMPEEK